MFGKRSGCSQPHAMVHGAGMVGAPLCVGSGAKAR